MAVEGPGDPQRLPPEDDVDTGEEKVDLRTRNPTYGLLEQRSVQSNDLRHVSDRVLREMRHPRGEQYVPGASAQRRLLVRGTQTTVANRLRFRASPWTTITGRRNPGPDPVGSGSSTQQTSPWAITIRHDAGCVLRRQ